MPEELEPFKLRYTDKSLHQLAYDGDIDTIRQWLLTGGSPNIRDANGQTLLHAAVHGAHYDLAALLLAHGADANACSDEFPYHTYPAQTAAYNGNVAILDLLVQYGADLTVETENGCTLIHLAVFNNEVTVMQYLLDHEADIEIPAEDDVTPLTSATMHDFVEATELLLRTGANPNAEDSFGMTPLSRVSNPAIVRMLIEHGADVNHVGQNGITPAFNARSLEALEVLLAHGARIDMVDNRGNTLLHQAAEEMILTDSDEIRECIVIRPLQQAMRIAELFIEHSLDINARNHAGKTPMGVAIEEKNEELAAFLREHGGVV
ncbi:MAG: Phosphocholine transferase AnkX [bacterium ADurb.Bin429]|nr:MAG: Phosphocholine transferase AnkX [bacterium ADurb.Bin429]